MDWTFVQKFTPMYVKAAGLTLRIAAVGVVLSMVVGLLCCIVQSLRIPVLRRVAAVYI